MYDKETQLIRSINEQYEAYIDYYGEPHYDDDPADYYVCVKGVRISWLRSNKQAEIDEYVRSIERLDDEYKAKIRAIELIAE